MQTIGILGGMSSAATGEYYKLINEKVKAIRGGYEIAELMICSVNFGNIERFVRTEDWDAAGKYLAEKAKNVENAGASCIFLATNTMHRVRDDIKAAISIPFVDIFETVSKEIKRQGKSRVGILGTYATMTGDFYVDAYREFGIEIIAPDEAQKRKLDHIIFEEMTNHIFTESSKQYFKTAIEELAAKGAEGVILGCTEIKMLIHQSDVPDIPLFDTTTLHCDVAAQICCGELVL